MKMVTSENVSIKHMSPIKYRKLKKLLSFFAQPIPEKAEVLLEISFYDGQELLADMHVTLPNGRTYKETVQTFMEA